MLVHDDALSSIQEKLEKHETLMSYARKPPADDVFWEGVPEDIKQGALNWISTVQERFPDEIDELRGEHGDWNYGFASGVTAALRFVLTAASEGPETADQWWPELDS